MASKTVKSRAQAWTEADLIFPTDYIKDEQASARANYPIFKSTAEGNTSWISDLGTRLEINFEDGSEFTIWIDEPVEPEKDSRKEKAYEAVKRTFARFIDACEKGYSWKEEERMAYQGACSVYEAIFDEEFILTESDREKILGYRR